MQQETKFKAATAKIAQVGSMFANAGGLELNFDEVTALLRSHIRTIAYSTASCLALALIYLLITPAQYTATALLLIDTRSNILQPSANVIEVVIGNRAVVAASLVDGASVQPMLKTIHVAIIAMARLMRTAPIRCSRMERR